MEIKKFKKKERKKKKNSRKKKLNKERNSRKNTSISHEEITQQIFFFEVGTPNLLSVSHAHTT